MLSVFSTLQETLFLWVRNFWYLFIISLVTDTPVVALEIFKPGTRNTQSPGLSVLYLIGLFLGLLLGAVKAGAILGLLRRQVLEKTAWAAAWNSVKNYTGTLFRLSILI